MPRVDDITKSEEPNDIAKLREQVNKKQEELAIKAGGQVAELTKKLGCRRQLIQKNRLTGEATES